MILELLRPLKGQQDFILPLDYSPYGCMMGFHLQCESGALITRMDYSADHIGAPFPPVLHGGTVASLMETAAMVQLIWDTHMKSVPATVDINIDYLRSGQPMDTFARARLYRIGRRFATMHAEAWQDNREKPIASAMLHFLMGGQQE